MTAKLQKPLYMFWTLAMYESERSLTPSTPREAPNGKETGCTPHDILDMAVEVKISPLLGIILGDQVHSQ
jgi:hypothetical protein